MTSARPMLERWEDFNLSLAGKNKSKKFVEIVQKYRNATDIHFVRFLLHESRDIVNEAVRGESLSIWPGIFPEFPTGNFAGMESAPVLTKEKLPSAIANRWEWTDLINQSGCAPEIDVFV